MKYLLLVISILLVLIPQAALAVEPDTADITVTAIPYGFVVVSISLIILAGGLGVLWHFGLLGGKREDDDNW